MADTGLHVSHSPVRLRDEIHGDIDYGFAYPVWSRFVLPGDTWKVRSSLLLRYQPLVAPPLTQSEVRVRFGFVPLRQIEENCELIITGSKDGHYNPHLVIPKFDDIFESVEKFAPGSGNAYKTLDSLMKHYGVERGSAFDWIYGLPYAQPNNSIDWNSLKGQESAPAAYWFKAFAKFLYDYYRDENFCPIGVDNFDQYYGYAVRAGGIKNLANSYASTVWSTYLRKDGYLTSALPWQLKGIAPTIGMSASSEAHVNFNSDFFRLIQSSAGTVPDGALPVYLNNQNHSTSDNPPFLVNYHNNSFDQAEAQVEAFYRALNDNTIPAISSTFGFNMSQFREMVAQTRIFERLARCGSRYVEYLRANFGTAPRDDTLQRAQYLGGFKIPIVTTEVLQTGEGDSPVGTMRGHGITNGGDRIHTCHFREFGIILAVLDVRPKLQWTQGVDREKTYKSRWDFYNPSFQHLSEQLARNGEAYYSYEDGRNDEGFGFIGYGQELKTSRTRMAGEMRGNLSYWNQAIEFSSRPSLNNAFLLSHNYLKSWHKPFVVTEGENPMILDFAVDAKVIRPMSRYSGIPGLVDHN